MTIYTLTQEQRLAIAAGETTCDAMEAEDMTTACMRCGGSGILVTGSRLTYEEHPCEVCHGTGQASNGGYGASK